MDFEKVPVPTGTKRGRPPLPNPYTDLFPTEEGEAVRTVVDGALDSREVKRLIRQARQAARDKGFSAFVQTQEVAPGGPVHVVAWTQEKVKRSGK